MNIFDCNHDDQLCYDEFEELFRTLTNALALAHRKPVPAPHITEIAAKSAFLICERPDRNAITLAE